MGKRVNHSATCIYEKKRSKCDSLRCLKNVRSNRLLHAFFGKTSAFGGALASFEFGIAFADHIKRATAFYHLAISMAAFGGIE